MDTQADKLHYSGYPGDVFPKQCGAGYGFGGHGQYGIYEGGVDANVVDYNVASRCGGEASLPEMPSCPPPQPIANANRCGPENFASLSVLAPQDVGCGMGNFWADKTCRLPPNHCGSQPCASACASATVENYVGDLGDAGRFAGLPADGCGAAVSDGCDTQLQMHRDPGYAGLRCSMPYSAPYHGGPGCGPSSARLTEGMEPSGPAPGPAPGPLPPRPMLPPPRPIIVQQPAPVIQVFPRISLSNLFIALIIAFIVYQSLKK
jgi:hypothetical protein